MTSTRSKNFTEMYKAYREQLVKNMISLFEKMTSEDVKDLWRKPIRCYLKTMTFGHI
jgi:hypothetical protein